MLFSNFVNYKFSYNLQLITNNYYKMKQFQCSFELFKVEFLNLWYELRVSQWYAEGSWVVYGENLPL